MRIECRAKTMRLERSRRARLECHSPPARAPPIGQSARAAVQTGALIGRAIAGRRGGARCLQVLTLEYSDKCAFSAQLDAPREQSSNRATRQRPAKRSAQVYKSGAARRATRTISRIQVHESGIASSKTARVESVRADKIGSACISSESAREALAYKSPDR